MFVVFEGIDGVGKSTQLRLLARFLESRSAARVTVLQEPGGTSLGEAIRALLLEPSGEELSAVTELFLFMAARSHLVARRIRPALAAGEIVLCDRFLWSSVVYQGIVGGVGIESVLSQGRLAVGDVGVTKTFVLDLPVDAATRRKAARGAEDRIERKGVEFQRRLRQGFLDLARLYPDHITVIDARGDEQVVHRRVREHLDLPGEPVGRGGS